MAIILAIVQALVCGYLCALCHPNRGWLFDLEYSPRIFQDAEDLLSDPLLLRSCEELSYLHAADCWQLAEDYKVFSQYREKKKHLRELSESMFSSPVGYILSVVSFFMLCFMLDTNVIETAIASVINIVAHSFFCSRYTKRKEEEVKYYIYRSANPVVIETIPEEIPVVSLAEKRSYEKLEREYSNIKSFRYMYIGVVIFFAFVFVLRL